MEIPSSTLKDKTEPLRRKTKVSPSQFEIAQFLFGVLFFFGFAFILGRYKVAGCLWFYQVTFPGLMVVRAFDFYHKRRRYFWTDFCYFTNYLTYYFISCDPSNEDLFRVCFASGCGHVCIALIGLRCSIVFHRTDYIITTAVHAFPMICLYTIRWFGDLDQINRSSGTFSDAQFPALPS